MTSLDDFAAAFDGGGRDDRWMHTVRISTKFLKVVMNLVSNKSDVINIRKRFSSVASALNQKENDVWLTAALIGLPILEERNVEKLSKIDRRLIIIGKEREKLAKDQVFVDELIPILQARGKEGFQEFLEDELEYDQSEIDRFWKLYQQRIDSLPWARRARLWIDITLRSKHEPMSTSQVKVLAKEAGIVEPDESNYDKFRKLAERMGVVSQADHGFWFHNDSSAL